MSTGNGQHLWKPIRQRFSFGGLIAVNELTMNVKPRRDLRPDRAERRRQNHYLQSAHRRLRTDVGRHQYRGTRINGMRPYEISRLGVSRTFQNIRLFPSMSVLENVVTACHRHAKQNMTDAVFRLPRYFKDENEHREFALELLQYLRPGKI